MACLSVIRPTLCSRPVCVPTAVCILSFSWGGVFFPPSWLLLSVPVDCCIALLFSFPAGSDLWISGIIRLYLWIYLASQILISVILSSCSRFSSSSSYLPHDELDPTRPDLNEARKWGEKGRSYTRRE
ncbi:uncharacterized protein BO95DRAFT_112549 [Aspergillus brunneoviolaceus CBS 621.78]|uniref:Uncharacterized protein n=1 Tax=Aspergillus brunneoviolaceus CBS 621.78 TaxID=1450534 RepID=A0ACD1GNH7_9EURO|nr:hypothetical protein BO95DRAFT_112549 [Aspergillus brunneoviolaceus CBS 621.78]RAH50762.1 hypothetical protein BO95DRAFT_112549 [Aspergillus brunneoviolaceus CBS 621.78]